MNRKIISILALFLLTSCTISLQNISTNGKASDLVDDQFETDPEVSTDLEIPFL